MRVLYEIIMHCEPLLNLFVIFLFFLFYGLIYSLIIGQLIFTEIA